MTGWTYRFDDDVMFSHHRPCSMSYIPEWWGIFIVLFHFFFFSRNHGTSAHWCPLLVIYLCFIIHFIFLACIELLLHYNHLMALWTLSGITQSICRSAPCLRQITMPESHHWIFYRPDALPAAQPTSSSTEGKVSCSLSSSLLNKYLTFCRCCCCCCRNLCSTCWKAATFSMCLFLFFTSWTTRDLTSVGWRHIYK